MSTVEFIYRLTGTGWAQAHIADGASRATISASYLEGALGDLLEAVGALLEGADAARCSGEEEPGEYRWIFEREGADVHLRVLAFRDLYSSEPDENGAVAFTARQPLATLAGAIADGAQAVLDEHGEEGYLRQWVDHPFPTAHLALIRSA